MGTVRAQIPFYERCRTFFSTFFRVEAAEGVGICRHVGARSDNLRLPSALPVGVRPERWAGVQQGR